MRLYTRNIPAVVVPLIALLAVIGGALVLRLVQPPPKVRPVPVVEVQPPAGPARPVRVEVFRSPLAGPWYSAEPNALRAEIAGYFEKAPVEPRADIAALVLPHAGYAYSGSTAAHGVKSLGRAFKRVVVIGPTHRLPMEEVLSVPRVTHYQTPLGLVALDTAFIERLLEHPLFQNVPAAHQGEHSVQIEVPLLQYKLGDFQLVPIVAGQCSPETVAKAGHILSGLIDEETLLVASSDFVHYGPRYQYVPFTDNIPENIRKLDMGAYEFIAKIDAAGLLDYKRRTGATICGCVPVAVLLSVLSPETKAELVCYTTSGELAGDYTNCVSYLAVTFNGAWQDAGDLGSPALGADLTEQDKKTLLSLARKTIRYGLDHQKVPQPADLDVTITDAMKAPRAAFVTLKKHGQLRGCIGDIFPQRPLYKSVIGNAVYAAFADRRFQPLQEDEFDEIEIEISALTVPEAVASPQEIRIGTDGMVLRKDGRSAVFLPQVAPEQGWDLETTLTHLSQKAGLAADAWQDGASFEVFQANVFGEER
ncbi:MAG: AmmeMemoRadiSam system protein B [Sedimentisphaerales bacterium]|nr:AmmeMemoRadiSam system protein B [Sedimentisphaerales bacterium]